MKKWFIIIGIVCLVFIWQLLMLYRGFKSTEVANAEQALTVARAETDLASVLSVDYYPGNDGYHVITGENSDGEDIVIWVQENNVWEEKLSEGVSREHILSQLPHAEVKRILPGLISTSDGKKQPIWDVYYISDEGETHYEYFDFFTGKSLKRIQL